MSSDLLKEFGSPEEDSWRGVASQSSANITSADEDDFGDFEDPEKEENTTRTHPSPSPPPKPASRLANPGHSGRKQSSLGQGSLQPLNHSSCTGVQDVLCSDDDWGNFSQHSVMFDADVEAVRQKKEADRTLVDQSRLKEPTNSLLRPTTAPEKSTPVSTILAIGRGNGNQKSQKLAEPRHQSLKVDSKRRVEATKATGFEEPTIDDEPWVDFEAADAAKPGSKLFNALPSRTFKAADASKVGPPPSNIPPPSILLAVIATVFGSLAKGLKTVTFGQPLVEPSTLSQLHALLSTIRAAARILAGRKLRWKRDHILSQSMKIGPAHSGRTGGMKLAGVDKAESRREDQEAAEALQIWKQQAGPLRSTVAALNGHLPENERFKVPEMADSMPIRQGKPSEGTVTAPKCCFLCGIKRDERVGNVDFDVEDSFGEWWVEHWGHIDCVAFWENERHLLPQR